MYKLVLLIWVFIFSAMVCQAQDASLKNKCLIGYSQNESNNESIEVSDTCEILKDIIKTKIEDDVTLSVNSYINPSVAYVTFSKPNEHQCKWFNI